MRSFAIILIMSLATSVFAAEGNASCEAKAVDKNGKPLAGAAKGSFIKKCEKDAADAGKAAMCEENALSKDGKKLVGAAKNASVKKCMTQAK